MPDRTQGPDDHDDPEPDHETQNLPVPQQSPPPWPTTAWPKTGHKAVEITGQTVTFSVNGQNVSIPLPPAMGGTQAIDGIPAAQMEAYSSLALIKAEQCEVEKQAMTIGFPAISALLGLAAIVSALYNDSAWMIAAGVLLGSLAIVIAVIIGIRRSRPAPFLRELSRRWDEEAARARK